MNRGDKVFYKTAPEQPQSLAFVTRMSGDAVDLAVFDDTMLRFVRNVSVKQVSTSEEKDGESYSGFKLGENQATGSNGTYDITDDKLSTHNPLQSPAGAAEATTPQRQVGTGNQSTPTLPTAPTSSGKTDASGVFTTNDKKLQTAEPENKPASGPATNAAGGP